MNSRKVKISQNIDWNRPGLFIYESDDDTESHIVLSDGKYDLNKNTFAGIVVWSDYDFQKLGHYSLTWDCLWHKRYDDNVLLVGKVEC